MLLDRHIYRGRLNYLLFGRRIEKVKGWLHRITAPAVKAEPEAQPTEDIALHRSYQYDPPPAPEPEPTPLPEPAKPPEAEAPPTAPPDDSAPAVSHPTPPPEGDNYNEDEEYMRHMANTDEGPQPGAVDADDLLVLLSDIDGLYTADPHKDPDAQRIDVVPEITDDILRLAEGKGSELGTGGMKTKLSAAQIVTKAGTDMIIANGADVEQLYALLDGRAIGTRFTGKKADA